MKKDAHLLNAFNLIKFNLTGILFPCDKWF